jgi:hypothetical protein
LEVIYRPDSEFDFVIAPNPNSGGHINLFINADEGTSLDLQIYDIAGRPVYSKVLQTITKGTSAFGFDFEQSLLSPGVYIVTLSSGPESDVARMIVN